MVFIGCQGEDIFGHSPFMGHFDMLTYMCYTYIHDSTSPPYKEQKYNEIMIGYITKKVPIEKLNNQTT